jgi:hypothetical protein
MHYIGIDPGVSGGIAILSTSGQVVDTTKMLPTERDIYEWLRERLTWFGNGDARAFAIIERVNAGVFAIVGVVSAFTFGRSYGTLLGILTGIDVPYEEVVPQRWQAMLQCLTRGDKNVSKRKAQQLFPGISVTHAIADALLLAEYGRRFQLGLFVQPSANRGTHGEEEGSTEKGKADARREGEGQSQNAEAGQRQRPEGRRSETAEAAAAGAGRHGARSLPRPGRVLRGHRRRA